jgi:8-oxo-dGTP pyrophosphatase MutT (NUDIX family)
MQPMKDLEPESTNVMLGRPSTKKARARRKQYDALPYRVTMSGSLELLLVTTRQTKRWTVPKGWPAKKLKPCESAAREAYEEAGVRGSVGTKSIGSFTYEKMLNDEGLSVC